MEFLDSLYKYTWNNQNTPVKLTQNYFQEISLETKKEKDKSSIKNEKKLNQLENLLSSSEIDVEILKSITWSGLPFENSYIRSDIWKILLDYYPLNKSEREEKISEKRKFYFDLCNLSQKKIIDYSNPNLIDEKCENFKTFKQILTDISRTMPENKVFSLKRIKSMMQRIIFLWCDDNNSIGYLQGFNDLCAPLLIVFLGEYIKFDYDNFNILEDDVINLGIDKLFEIEADTFWCFRFLIKSIIRFQKNEEILVFSTKIQEILNLVDQSISNHFEKNEIKIHQFCFRWIKCLLIREMNLKCLIRLWDTYLTEDNGFVQFHLFVCTAIILCFSNKIKSFEMNELTSFLYNLPTSKWGLDEVEMLIAEAYKLQTLYGNKFKM